MTKTVSNIKKLGLVLTIACLLGGQLSAGNWGWDDANTAKPASEDPKKGSRNNPKPTGYIASAKEKVKPVTDYLDAHRGKYYLVIGIAVTATTKWLYEKGKINYLVTNDAALQDVFREIDCNENFDAVERAEEKKKAIAKRVAEYFTDESLLDTIMKSTQGLLSYLF